MLCLRMGITCFKVGGQGRPLQEPDTHDERWSWRRIQAGKTCEKSIRVEERV